MARTVCDVEKLGLDGIDDGVADLGVKLAREKYGFGVLGWCVCFRQKGTEKGPKISYVEFDELMNAKDHRRAPAPVDNCFVLNQQPISVCNRRIGQPERLPDTDSHTDAASLPASDWCFGRCYTGGH